MTMPMGSPSVVMTSGVPSHPLGSPMTAKPRVAPAGKGDLRAYARLDPRTGAVAGQK